MLSQMVKEYNLNKKQEFITHRDLNKFEEKNLSVERRRLLQEKSLQMHRHGKPKVNANMPLGKTGQGIESYSSLDNPDSTPISNYYCQGYKEL